MAIKPGQTFGMWVGGIRLERSSGKPVGFLYALFRFYIWGLIFMIPAVSIAMNR